MLLRLGKIKEEIISKVRHRLSPFGLRMCAPLLTLHIHPGAGAYEKADILRTSRKFTTSAEAIISCWFIRVEIRTEYKAGTKSVRRDLISYGRAGKTGPLK